MLEARDCPTVNVSVLAAFDGSEGQQDGSFLLFRDNTSGSLSVNYSLVSQPLNGGPIAVPEDGPTSPPLLGTVTFAPGEDQATITLPMPQNDLRQGSQQVALTLAPGVGYTVYQPEPDHVLLTDDEDDDSIWIEEIQNAVEGGDVGFVRVGRADPTGYRSVPYSILSGPDMATMGIDYAPLSGTLVFLPGQRTAEVVIDATGPFVDVAVEGDETVTLLFMPPPPVGPAQPPIEAKPIIRDARPGNDAPVFQLPPGKAFYEFYLGDLTPSNTYVDNVFATDADADEVTYSISNGNADGVFKLDPKTGDLKLAKDLTGAMPTLYAIQVKASDGRGGVVTEEVIINVVPMVVLTGDRHGVEASISENLLPNGNYLWDTIELTFRRFSRDISQPLTVHYKVPMNAAQGDTATRADFDNPNVLTAAGVNTGTIVIPANKATATISIGLAEDGQLESMEKFRVMIEDDLDREYVTIHKDSGVDRISFNHLPGRPVGEQTATLLLLDDVQLFASENLNIVEGWALADEDSPVDLNDVDQGAIPNCWFTAAIGAIAWREPGSIHTAPGGPGDMLVRRPDGTVAVRYYVQTPLGLRPRLAVVDMTLDYGIMGTELSGDYEDKQFDDNNDGIIDRSYRSYEVWPNMLEKGMRRILHDTGSPQSMTSIGHADVVWNLLTPGQPVNKAKRVDIPKVLAQGAVSVNQMVAAYGAGKKVVLASRTLKEVDLLPTDPAVVSNHAYVVWHTTATEVKLYNPWGYKHITVMRTSIPRFFDTWYYQ